MTIFFAGEIRLFSVMIIYTPMPFLANWVKCMYAMNASGTILIKQVVMEMKNLQRKSHKPYFQLKLQ